MKKLGEGVNLQTIEILSINNQGPMQDKVLRWDQHQHLNNSTPPFADANMQQHPIRVFPMKRLCHNCGKEGHDIGDYIKQPRQHQKRRFYNRPKVNTMDEAKIRQEATNNLTKTSKLFEVARMAMDRQKNTPIGI